MYDCLDCGEKRIVVSDIYVEWNRCKYGCHECGTWVDLVPVQQADGTIVLKGTAYAA